jgi:cell division protein FtsQ
MWTGIGCICIILLAAGIKSKNASICKGIDISIKGENVFIGKQDVTEVVQSFAGKKITGKAIDEFDLVAMENALKKEVWIKKAELFFDNNNVLQAEIHEREPVARVFSAGGNSFYIDSTMMMLPLSDKLSARVPVFTNFPSEAKVLSKPDSNLLKDIKAISLFIQKDSFLMAMIEQVEITGQRQFEMVPKIGDQLIVFGDAKDAEQKFTKLKLFYRKVIPKFGWSRYDVISLQYKGQLVAKIKGKEDVKADSLRTLEMMQAIASYSSKMASDSTQTIQQDNTRNSTDISLILQSFQRDDAEPNVGFEEEIKSEKRETGNLNPAVPDRKPETKTIKPAVKTIKTVIKTQPAQKKKPADTKQVKPKVVMPKSNNEY